jgi:cell division protein FtsL
MSRVQFALVVALVLCALSVVKANHEARKLFVALGTEQKRARDLDTEWGQLQLEQSTWAAHIRVENLARAKLGMHPPAAGEVLMIDAATAATATSPGAAAKPAAGATAQSVTADSAYGQDVAKGGGKR